MRILVLPGFHDSLPLFLTPNRKLYKKFYNNRDFSKKHNGKKLRDFIQGEKLSR